MCAHVRMPHSVTILLLAQYWELVSRLRGSQLLMQCDGQTVIYSVSWLIVWWGIQLVRQWFSWSFSLPFFWCINRFVSESHFTGEEYYDAPTFSQRPIASIVRVRGNYAERNSMNMGMARPSPGRSAYQSEGWSFEGMIVASRNTGACLSNHIVSSQRTVN